MTKKGFGMVGEPLQIVIRKNDNSIQTNVNWDDIVWSEVKEIGLKSESHVIGFHKDMGCIVWYPLLPLELDKPLFYVYQKAWGKIGSNWHRFYITVSNIQRTPYYQPNNDIIPDERRLGWTGTINYNGNEFPVNIGVKAEPMALPQALKTEITTPINLDDCGIEYQFYLNPEYADDAEKNIKWVRIYTDYDNDNPENSEYNDYDIKQFMEITDIPELPIYIFSFHNQDKSKCLGHFNFTDIFTNSENRLCKIEEVTLPNSETTYCIRIGASFGEKLAGESLVIDPTFGYTDQDSTQTLSADKYFYYEQPTSPESNGTATGIWVWIDDSTWDSNEEVKCALYSGDGSTKLVETEERKDGGGSGDQFYKFTIDGGYEISSEETYLMVIFVDDEIGIGRKAYAYYGCEGSAVYPTFEQPLETDDCENGSVPIYCEYDEEKPFGELYQDTSNYGNELYLNGGNWTI